MAAGRRRNSNVFRFEFKPVRPTYPWQIHAATSLSVVSVVRSRKMVATATQLRSGIVASKRPANALATC
jgi:hypothetical protein